MRDSKLMINLRINRFYIDKFHRDTLKNGYQFKVINSYKKDETSNAYMNNANGEHKG